MPAYCSGNRFGNLLLYYTKFFYQIGLIIRKIDFISISTAAKIFLCHIISIVDLINPRNFSSAVILMHILCHTDFHPLPGTGPHDLKNNIGLQRISHFTLYIRTFPKQNLLSFDHFILARRRCFKACPLGIPWHKNDLIILNPLIFIYYYRFYNFNFYPFRITVINHIQSIYRPGTDRIRYRLIHTGGLTEIDMILW